YHVSAESPPTLIVHGDKDRLVPLQQSERIAAKFKDAGVPVELIVRKGAEHGWKDLPKDLEKFADWFDKYLKPEKKEPLAADPRPLPPAPSPKRRGGARTLFPPFPLREGGPGGLGSPEVVP